jgi:hypothetical protein
MKSSLIRSGAAAIVAALAFAACAGNGSVPSSSLPNTANSMHAAAPNGTGAPCPLPVGWIFGGPCDTVPLTTSGGSGSLKAYMGFTLTATLGGNNAKKGTALIFEDATGKGDITGKVNGKKFPVLKGALLYLAALNTGKEFTFQTTPAIVIKSKTAIKGKLCTLNQLITKGKGFAWNPTPIQAKPTGKSVSFGSFPVAETIPAGPFFLAFGCK